MALAVEQAPAAVVTPEAAFWKSSSIGDASRIPAKLQALTVSPVGSVAVQDMGYGAGDEIIIGSGSGQEPTVSIFGGDGLLLQKFAVYDPGMKFGVNVAVGDIDGDGQMEIVTGTRPGAAPHVLVYDGHGRLKAIAGGFFPFDREFRGGVSVAVGDVDSDGTAEIVTAAGPGGESRVSVWKKPFMLPTADFMAFDTKSIAGLSIAAGDVDGDGTSEILTAMPSQSGARVRIFAAVDPSVTAGDFEISESMEVGLNLTSGDINGDGRAEIIVAPDGPSLGQVTAFDRNGKILAGFQAGEANSVGGSVVAVGRFDAIVGKVILTVPADRDSTVRPTAPQAIVVDISEQRLRAYEYGREVKTFLVSTGTTRFPTPLGNFSVLAKKPTVLYRWSYGPKNPDNYDLGVVPWNLMIMPHIYIHYAPWHNNFGRRVSHGCVNVNLTNIKWIYNWAEVGTPVDIVE